MATQVPRPELVAVADALDQAVMKYLAMERPTTVTMQSPVAGLVMSWIVARNIQAVALLARTDELLFPAVWPNARAAFEIGLRIIWILFPGDPFECELRLLPVLDEYARYNERMEARKPEFAIPGRHAETANGVRATLEALRARIPKGRSEPPRIPDMPSILKEIGNEHLYPAYIEGSQYPHGTMAASAAYKRGSATFAEAVNLREWLLPMRLSWITLQEVAKIVTLRLTGISIDWGGDKRNMDSLFKALAAADPSQ